LVERFERNLDAYTLQKQLPNTKTSHDQTLVQRQIDATDRQIDRLVYELYGVTEEEIAMIDGGM